MTLEDIKQRINFDQQAAEVIARHGRRNARLSDEDRQKIVNDIVQNVNPRLIQEAESWGKEAPRDVSESEHGKFKISMTDDFMKLLKELAHQYLKKEGLPHDKKTVRQKTKRLKVATLRGVAKINPSGRGKK